MSQVAIRIEGLGKRYRLRHAAATSSGSLRESLTQGLASLWRGKAPREEFWALKDVNLQFTRGERVGLVGRNGAGKSTLLRVLSQITEPTEGRATIYGRVVSLLEVGTGFHPELTGRENIYLSASILGMERREIDRKFDEIVAFAETEKFLDTPVKRYSSGMYVRLAFAVAAHLDAEILLVDEVLAVGDAAFQRKCLGKMESVAVDGRTLIFVSHNMGALAKLCTKSVWLDGGMVRHVGATENVIRDYLQASSGGVGENLVMQTGREGFRLLAVRVLSRDGDVCSTVDIRYPFCVELEYDIAAPIQGLRTGFRLLNSQGIVVLSTTDQDDAALRERPRAPGRYVSRVEIPGALLNQGGYSVSVGIDVPLMQSILFVDNAVSFHVEITGGLIGDIPDNRQGVVIPLLPWKIETAGRNRRAEAA